jgi:glycosyltransferase involved in cell wall biosynthesis
MPLTVLQVAFPFAPVGADAVGGAEQILSACDAAVVRAGYRSIVVACEGSRTCGELVAVPRVSRADDPHVRAAAHDAHREAIENAIGKFGVDVAHCHGIDFDAYIPAEGVNVLVTLHLDPQAYSVRALTSERAGTFFNCVSLSQHARCPKLWNLLPPIANGVDVDELQPDSQARRAHALVLARICPEKCIHLAVDAAKKAELDLIVAGEIFPYAEHQRYFAEHVQPLLDAQRVFIGPVGFAEKRKLLQSARGLLVPSLIEETSSLVAMEALACGTPVIAFRRGALPEIVQDRVTGFLVDNAEQMAAAIANVNSLSAADCVGAARRRFDAARMTREYIELYERLAEGQSARRQVRRAASCA